MDQPVQPESESQPVSHHVDDQVADIADQVPNLPVTDMDNMGLIIAQQAQQQWQQVIDRLDTMLAGIDSLRAAVNNLQEMANNLREVVNNLQAQVGALQAGAGALQAMAGSAQWTWHRVDKLGIIIIVWE